MQIQQVSKKQVPLSESLLVCVPLTLVGGFLDAYTYLCRGHIFANAITGDLVLMAIHLAQGQFFDCLCYGIIVALYGVGVLTSRMIERFLGKQHLLHWRQIVILLEAALLTAVTFLPAGQGWDLVISGTIAFTCAMQVQAFRSVLGITAATTMCTGNLRSGTDCLHQYFVTKQKTYLRDSLRYYSVIGLFVVGVILGTFCTNAMQHWATLLCVGALLLVFGVLFREQRSNPA